METGDASALSGALAALPTGWGAGGAGASLGAATGWLGGVSLVAGVSSGMPLPSLATDGLGGEASCWVRFLEFAD